MAEPAIFLLEAYTGAAGLASVSVDVLRAQLEAHVGLRVIGLVEVPVDEAVLCLIAADSEASLMPIADMLGPAARLLRVTWTSGATWRESATEVAAR